MKKVASRLPYVGRLMAERTIIAGERDRIDAERGALARERDRIAAERDGLANERDRLLAGRDDLLADNAALRIQVGAVESERDRYKAWMPPGHYYSPVPSLEEIRARDARSSGPRPCRFPAWT
jgi:methyl-accepting chemotaxis protein